jgi:hypothetical protein
MNSPSGASAQVDLDWQRKLLPFMTRAITVMGLLFFISSSVQLYLMYLELKLEPDTELLVPGDRSGSGTQSEESRRWNGLIALEHETMVRENQIVNAVILRQTSLLHLGFLTGMALCLVGAVFVLGRLQDSASSLSGEAQTLKFALNTSSPGIILVILGSGLMLATLYHQFQFNLPDKAVYLSPIQYSVEKPGDPRLQKSSEKPSAGLMPQRAEEPGDAPVQQSDEESSDLPAQQSDRNPSEPP